MARRLLSTAVRVKAAPSEAERAAAILLGDGIRPYMPTESEMRDALARLTRDLEDMRLARTDGGATGWQAVDGEFTFMPVTTAEGEVALRGALVIERPD